MKELVVVSLGGSLLYQNGALDKAFLKKIVALLKKHVPLAVFVGGGSPAKRVVELVKGLGANDFWADRAAIAVTKHNARLVKKAFGRKAELFDSLDDAARILSRRKIAVGGGLCEGLTTDADAVLLAEMMGAKRLVNLSVVDGVYSRDPSKPGAKKFKAMTHKQLVALAAKTDARSARTNFVFDLVACKLAARSDIELHFVNGGQLNQAEKALKGKTHNGTTVKR